MKSIRKMSRDQGNIFWSYVGTGLSISVNIILLPFVLHFLSAPEIGMWYVFSSLNVLVNLLDFGFNATLMRNVAYAWNGSGELKSEGVGDGVQAGEVSRELLANVIHTCRFIYAGISIVALALMVSLGTAYVHVVSQDPGNPMWEASWIVYAAGVFLNLYYGYMNACLRGINSVAENYKTVAASKLLQLALTPVLLILGFGLLGTSVAYFFSCIILRAMLSHYLFSSDLIPKLSLRELAALPKQPIKDLVKTIWHNAWRDGLVTVSIYLSTQANTLICSAVLGLSSASTYGLSIQITTVISNLAYIWYNANMPKIQGYVARGENSKVAGVVRQSLLAYSSISVAGYAVFVIAGPPVIGFFKPTMTFDMTVLVLICGYMFLYRGINLFASVISCYNTIPYMPAFATTSVASVLLSYACAAFLHMGELSLVLPPILANLAYNVWKWPREASKLMRKAW